MTYLKLIMRRKDSDLISPGHSDFKPALEPILTQRAFHRDDGDDDDDKISDDKKADYVELEDPPCDLDLDLDPDLLEFIEWHEKRRQNSKALRKLEEKKPLDHDQEFLAIENRGPVPRSKVKPKTLKVNHELDHEIEVCQDLFVDANCSYPIVKSV